MLCSAKDVFCPDDADYVRGSPLVTEEEDILIGLASWHQSCSAPLIKGQYSVGVYTDIVNLQEWVKRTVYRNGGPGTGICCRGNYNSWTFLFTLSLLFTACDPYSCHQEDDFNIQLLSTVEANVKNVDKTLELNTNLRKQRDGSCAEAHDIVVSILDNLFLNAIYKTDKLEKESQCEPEGSRR